MPASSHLPSHPPSPPVPAAISVLPVVGIEEVHEGDDLVGLLSAALVGPLALRDGDVVCVSAKIVSKAAGLRIDPSQKEAAIDAASVREVARRRHVDVQTRIVQLEHGPVMAAAGIDASNSPNGLLLLPADPDAWAEKLRAGLTAVCGTRIGVLLTDTSSRIWRQGVGDIALGAAGVASLEDLRGSADAQGRTMSVTVRDLADEIAAAADLVKGKVAGVPAAIIRGLDPAVTDPARAVPARALSRTGSDDWFRRPSLESVWEALGLGIDRAPVAQMAPEPLEERIDRAITVATAPRLDAGEGAAAHIQRSDDGTLAVVPVGPGAQALIAAATVSERLRTALAAEAIADGDETLLAMRVALSPGSGAGSPTAAEPESQEQR